MMTAPQAVHALSSVKDQQSRWAKEHGLEIDVRGYVSDYAFNLFKPLTAKTKAAFENADGGELISQPRRPAKMSALHSSSALAVNVFDYWCDKEDRLPLQKALGLNVAIGQVEFEVKYPTGLPGNAPNLDVVLRLTSGETIALESKFTEWLTPKPPNKEWFKPKYFPRGEGIWAARGITKCQRLAEDLAAGAEGFRYLDAGQLLKHALGLSSSGESCSLFYIYYDCPGAESEQHRLEIERFEQRVGSEIGFRSLSYQDLFVALWQRGNGKDGDYWIYLMNRYFFSVDPSLFFPDLNSPVGTIVERWDADPTDYEIPPFLLRGYQSR
jgi:hypothetical protein